MMKKDHSHKHIIVRIDIPETSHRIKMIMQYRGYTPCMLQHAMGLVSLQAIYKWINPQVPTIPSIDNLVLLAYIFDCKIDDLLVVKAMIDTTSRSCRH